MKRACHRAHACRQRGVALITAMLVTAFVVVVSVAMVSRLQLDMRRTGNILLRDQAYIYALGLESFVDEVLKKDDQKKDDLGEPWAFEGLRLPFENGQLMPYVEDLQGRFNINNLVQKNARSEFDIQRFKNLLEILRLDALADPDQAENESLLEVLRNLNSGDLANAVADWLDGDTESLPGGGEDSDYQNGPRPYRTANHYLTSPSELLLVHGFNPVFYKFVEPYVAALPMPVTINVNTAKEPVIRALAEDVNCIHTDKINRPPRKNPFADLGKELVAAPAYDTFTSADEFLKQDAFAGCKLIGTLMRQPANAGNPGQDENNPDESKQPKDASGTNGQGGAQPPAGAQSPSDVLSPNSQFFLLSARAEMGSGDQVVGVTLYSVIQRINGKLATIARSQGVY